MFCKNLEKCIVSTPFLALYSISSQRMVLSIPIQHPSTPPSLFPPTALVPVKFAKHKETQAMSIYLGIHRIVSSSPFLGFADL